jgi:hypothetical protein
MNKKQILLPSKRFFKAEEENLNLPINLDESETLLREGDRNIVLDIAQLFDKERNESKKYKIHGKLKMVFRNLYTGSTTYDPLKSNLFYNSYGTDLSNHDGAMPYNEFAFLRKDVLREVFTGQTGSTLTQDYSPENQIILTGTTYTGHTITTSIEAPYKNWNIYLSYVNAHDENYPMMYTLSGTTNITCDTTHNFCFTAKDGIPFRVINNGKYYSLVSPVEHGMKAGEYVILSTTGNTFYAYSGDPRVRHTTTTEFNRTFYIESVGNETFRSEKFVINILKKELVSGTTLNTVVFGKRCLNKFKLDKTKSKYYVHKHKTLTEVKDYILDKIGFESSIWEEERALMYENSDGVDNYLVEQNRMESLIYDFKEPFVLTGLTNNLNYTPTEVYVTVLLRNQNGYFNYPPKVGYKFNFHNTWIDNHFGGTGSTETNIPTNTFTSNNGTAGFTAGSELTLGTSGLTGAFVEYNESELTERIVSESYHKFTCKPSIFNHGQTSNVSEDGVVIFSGASAFNPLGYFYQPHHRIKLRELSPYVESYNTNEIYGLPENARYFPDEKLWKWRDLYDNGFIDAEGFGTNYPFINGIHYVKKDINFYLRNEVKFKNKEDGVIKFTNLSFDC